MADDKYRQHLVETYEQLSIGYARTLVTLAGGALALTLGFAKDIVGAPGDQCRGLLIAAWVFWSIALTCVLAGFYFGRQAAWYARTQWDNGNPRPTGGGWTRATHIVGFGGLFTFVLGVAAIILYVSLNLE